MAEMKHCGTAIRILLGGGIGSGKSLAGRRLEELGATVIEADRLGHAVLEPDAEAFGMVSQRWPSVVVDYRIDRHALAEFVFADRAQLTELEALTHPAIIRRINGIASEEDVLVIEIPLILNVAGDWTKVFVDANEDLRLDRAVKRGSTEADVRRRMASQPRREEWLEWCDKTVDSNGSMEDLDRQIESLWYRLRNTDHGL